MKKKVIGVDMHCHLIPGVDDGSDSLDESLEIIEAMRKNGIHQIYLTPHMYSSAVESKPELFQEQFEKLKRNVNEDMKLEMGSEVHIIPGVSKKDVIPLGNSGYLLVEFPSNTFPVAAEKELTELQKKDYKIILAHVERYDYLFKKKKSGLFKIIFEPTDFLKQLKNMGVLFQVNWSTIIKPSAKDKKIINMLELYYWLDFTGSDKHSLRDKRELINTNNQKYANLMNEELAL